MNAQIAIQFSRAFDPAVKEHVMWLKAVHQSLETMDTTKCQIHPMVNRNPMGIEFREKDVLDWVHVHFALNFKYGKAVLMGAAYIPPGTPQA